jgi:hypothetical protein
MNIQRNINYFLKYSNLTGFSKSRVDNLGNSLSFFINRYLGCFPYFFSDNSGFF